jgi:hypothetical protein
MTFRAQTEANIAKIAASIRAGFKAVDCGNRIMPEATIRAGMRRAIGGQPAPAGIGPRQWAIAAAAFWLASHAAGCALDTEERDAGWHRLDAFAKRAGQAAWLAILEEEMA